MQKVALVGLGVMGAGMASNLLKAGFPLAVYNRTQAKAEPFAALGAQIAATPREAAAGADVILSMVGDDQSSRDVWLGENGILAGASVDAVLIECSTLSLEWIHELAELASQHGNQFLDSPVFGSKEAAATGALRLVIGGNAATIDAVKPVLEAISKEIVHMGPNGAGMVMKLINNMMASVQAVALAEGIVLAERAGLNMETVMSQILNGAVGSPIVKGKAPRMVAHNYENTEFALRWMHKDATYALRIADEFGSPLPTVATAREVYRMARNLGLEDADFSAVIEALRQVKK